MPSTSQAPAARLAEGRHFPAGRSPPRWGRILCEKPSGSGWSFTYWLIWWIFRSSAKGTDLSSNPRS
jgi:hypothetical protein